MSVTHKITSANGITRFLSDYRIGKIPKRQKEIQAFYNRIIWRYAKEFEIKLCRNNPLTYKGEFSPFIENAHIVQNDWKQFRKWVVNNFERKQNER